MGPGLSDDSTNSPNVRISDFLCESFYQHSSDSDTARLEYGFTSPSRIDHLVKLFKANIGRWSRPWTNPASPGLFSVIFASNGLFDPTRLIPPHLFAWPPPARLFNLPFSLPYSSLISHLTFDTIPSYSEAQVKRPGSIL